MKSHLFGHMPDGTAVQAFSLRSSSGLSATIAQYGARITELLVPTAGGARNVTLGFDRLEPYLSDDRHLGAVAAAWTLAWPGVTGAIMGARRPAQVDGWISAATLELSRVDLQEIADAIAKTGAGAGPALPPLASV